MIRQQICIATLCALAFPTGLSGQAANPDWLKWVGCYHLSVEDAVGNLRSHSTFSLGETLVPGQRGRRLEGTLVAGDPNDRTGWSIRAGDSLDIATMAVDVGHQAVVATAPADSMRGRYSGMGLGSTSPPSRRAVVRRAGDCASQLSVAIQASRIYGYAAGRGTPAGAAIGEPAWLVADSMVSSAPDGRRFVRNALLLEFESQVESARARTFQEIGGLVVGSVVPPGRGPTGGRALILWVVEGATMADLTRVIERVKGNPAVKSLTPMFRSSGR